MAVDEIERIYQEHVLDHYEAPYHRGRCPFATHADEGENPLCGDVVRIELKLNDDATRIEDAWFEGDGCCISQAAASMLMEATEGKSLEEIKRLTAEEMLELFGVPLTPNRQKCCLLCWRVLQSALHAPLPANRACGAGGSDESPGAGEGN